MIQYLDVNIPENGWTEGRWSIPKDIYWKNKIEANYDIVAFNI